DLAQLVVRDGEQVRVGRIELQKPDGDAVEAEPARGLKARVAADHLAILLAGDNGRAPSKALDGAGDLVDGLVVLARVTGPRAQAIDRHPDRGRFECRIWLLGHALRVQLGALDQDELDRREPPPLESAPREPVALDRESEAHFRMIRDRQARTTRSQL